MTRWCIASANVRPAGWPWQSQTGWRRSGCACIPTRPGSWTARTANDELPSSTPRLASSASRSAPARHAAETTATSRRFCPRSATTPCTRPAHRCGPSGCTSAPATPSPSWRTPATRSCAAGWEYYGAFSSSALQPLPEAQQRLPAALAPQELQAAARVQAGQAMLGRHHPPCPRHVRALAVEPRPGDQGDKSPVSREAHAGICGSRGVQLPPGHPTRMVPRVR